METKMPIFCIGYSNSYGTLHGMYNYNIIRTNDYKEAEMICSELAEEVLTDYESYIFPEGYKDEDEWAEEKSGWFGTISYTAIKEEHPDLTMCKIVNNIEDIASDLIDSYGVDDFMTKFCYDF